MPAVTDMDEFEIPPGKKPRYEVQSGGPLAVASSLVDDMDDFYGTPPAEPGSATGSPKTVSNELLHQPGVTSGATGATSFSLPGLQKVNGGGNGLDAKSLEKTKDVGIEGASNVPNGALEVDLKDTNPTGGAGVYTGALEGHWGSHSFTRLPENPVGGVASNDVVSVGNAQNTIGIADLDQTQQVQARPDASVVSASTHKSKDQMEWEQAPAVQLVVQVLSEEQQRKPSQSDTTSNEPGVPVPDLQMTTSTQQDELSVIAVPVGLQAGITGVCSDMGDRPQPSAMPVTSGELRTECNLSGDLTTEQRVGTNTVQNAEAEFEVDSSPIESSSEDSSDSSSEDSSDNEYEMLNPAEQARLLMQEDGGSDDEGGKKGAASAPLRTLNERPDEVVEKPNISVTEDVPIEELGEAETIVENLVLIKAKTTGEYKVLETGSLLCLKDRTVIGVVAETLGRVQQPLYTVHFTNVAAISESGISKSTAIYYVPQHSTFVFTQAITAIKGSDASNIHDEEVGDDELEFSDDEAEAEFKRNQKLQRQAKRGGRGASTNGYSRGSRENGYSNGNRNGNSNAERSQVNVASISYDDDVGGDEDLYTPLARPSDLHEHPGQGVHGESSSGSRHHDRGGHGSRGRGGNSKGRGDRGRGDRGRGDYGRGHRGRVRDRGNRQAGFNGSRGDRPAGFNGNRSERQGSVHSDNSRPPPPVPDLSLPPAPPPPRPPYSMGPPQPPVPPPSFTRSYSPYSSQQTFNHQPYSQSYPSGPPQYPYHQGQPASQQPQLPNFQPPQQQYSQQSHYPQQPYHPVNASLNGQTPPSQPTPPLPPGSFVNPAFFSNTFQQPARQPEYPPQYNGFPPSQQNGYSGR